MSLRNPNRRDAITVALGSAFILPAEWRTPIVDTVLIPAHAATSPIVEDDTTEEPPVESCQPDQCPPEDVPRGTPPETPTNTGPVTNDTDDKTDKKDPPIPKPAGDTGVQGHTGGDKSGSGKTRDAA